MNIRIAIVAAIILVSARLLPAAPLSIEERLDTIRKAAATLDHPITKDAAINTMGLSDDYESNPPAILSLLNHEHFYITINKETHITFVVFPNGNVKTIEIYRSGTENSHTVEKIYSQQGGPGYPPQGVGSPDP